MSRNNRPKTIPSVYARGLIKRLVAFADPNLHDRTRVQFIAADLGVSTDFRDPNPAYGHELDTLGTLVALNFLKEKRNGSGSEYMMSRESFARLKDALNQH